MAAAHDRDTFGGMASTESILRGLDNHLDRGIPLVIFGCELCLSLQPDPR
jgi:hypothetical protein